MRAAPPMSDWTIAPRGRTAGYLIARFIGPRPAKVAMIAGSLSYRAHEEREMGFLHVFEELFPAIKVVGLREGHDDADRNYRQTRMLLGQHPDLAGIYNIGGAADGVARALKEMNRARDVVFIGHGLTSDTRSLLIDGDDGRGHHPKSAEHDDELRRYLQQSAGRPKRHARHRGAAQRNYLSRKYSGSRQLKHFV